MNNIDNLRTIYNSNEYKESQRLADLKVKEDWDNLNYDIKLNILNYVGQILVKHAIEGGSYRYLLYDRLGLDMDAYGYLLDSYMTISNEFILIDIPSESELIKKFNDIINKIPVYLTEEDKEKWNFNKDRGLAFDFLHLIKDMHKKIALYQEQYNRLLDEVKLLTAEFNEFNERKI